MKGSADSSGSVEARETRLTRYEDGRSKGEVDDVLATEEPLEIRVEGRPIAVVMRTPGYDRELAAGFLLTEGVIKSTKDLFDITSCIDPGAAGEGNAVDVALTHPDSFDFEKLTRHVFTSSSCGICSKASIDAVMKRRKPLHDEMRVKSRVLLALPDRLARKQDTFKSTGGLHACALFDAAGKLLALREDVGRHNALDKLLGWALLEKRTPLHGHIALLSGRASFEMMQKAHAGGIAMVAAISAPSSLAVEFAREAGQTLVGFLRGRSMNVYAGAERITR
ncbi:MAG: formate dehydrogenase accessory sulfurtransferase FdhD [Chthoniobacter sp.]|nr:formate dehydrogenase accessory sulfurtransferase FdhD [Chthoniobacter sp.]